MKKKILSMLLATSMVATLATGCASNTNSKASSSEKAKETAKSSITYWSMWNSTENQAKVIKEAAQSFEKNTGTHVNIQFKGRDVRKLLQPALEAGEKIDLFDGDYQNLCVHYSKYLTDLSTLKGGTEFEKHVMPIILDSAKSWCDGKLMVVPYQVYTTGVWYNKDMFEKAGIKQTPKTWDEFLTVCQKLKNSGVNAITCNSDTCNLLYGFQLARYIGQNAVLDCLKNSKWTSIPAAKKAAEDIQTLFKKGYMSEYAPAQYPNGQNEIGFGETAMILNASWIPNEIAQNTGKKINWGFFPWPSVKGGVDGAEASMIGAQSIGIFNKSKNQQKAFDFAKTIATGKFDLKMAQSVSGIPSDINNKDWPKAVAAARPYFKATKKKYDWAVGLESNPKFTQILNDNVIKLYKKELTPDQFVKEMQKAK